RGRREAPVTEAAAGRDLVALPRAAVLMLWSAAYLRGDLGPDDAAQMSYGVGRSGPSGEGEDLFEWMTGLRRLPLAQLRLVLPVPGRLAGLVGPPAAIGPALEAEQAIVVTAAGIADHTLIPVVTPVRHDGRTVSAVTWLKVPAPVGAQVHRRRAPAVRARSCCTPCGAPRAAAWTSTWSPRSPSSRRASRTPGSRPRCPGTSSRPRPTCWCSLRGPCCSPGRRSRRATATPCTWPRRSPVGAGWTSCTTRRAARSWRPSNGSSRRRRDDPGRAVRGSGVLGDHGAVDLQGALGDRGPREVLGRA